VLRQFDLFVIRASYASDSHRGYRAPDLVENRQGESFGSTESVVAVDLEIWACNALPCFRVKVCRIGHDAS
jgi:hypothetical protein